MGDLLLGTLAVVEESGCHERDQVIFTRTSKESQVNRTKPRFVCIG